MMVGSAIVMVISMVLPYIVSTVDSAISVSVLGAVGGNADLIPSSKALYTIIAGSLGIAALFAGLSVTGRKVWGVLRLIVALIILAFHGLLMIGLQGEERFAGFGIRAWIIMLASAVLVGSSIAFLASKKRI